MLRTWLLVLLPIAAFAWWGVEYLSRDRRPIVVGLLHARSGPTAESEKPLLEAEILALEEIERAGGLLGRSVRWVVADGGADRNSFARQAERLIREERADVLIGCWTPATRKAVVSVVEAADHLLIHPTRHEGMEESPHVVSLGPLPNQIVAPAVAWCRRALAAKRFFIVGGEGVWARAAIALVGDQLKETGAEIIGERLISAGGQDLTGVAREISVAAPDLVLAFLDPASAAAMLRRLREAGVRASETPTMLFSVSENELRAMPREDISGNYAVSSHFQRDSRPLATGLAREGPGGGRIDSDEAFSAYQAVRMWAGAVAAAGSADVPEVRSAIRRQSLATSEGVIAVDPQSLHVWRGFSVGRIRPDGSVEVERTTVGPTRPAPFPATRSRAEWTRFQAGTPRDPLPQRSSPTAATEMGAAP